MALTPEQLQTLLNGLTPEQQTSLEAMMSQQGPGNQTPAPQRPAPQAQQQVPPMSVMSMPDLSLEKGLAEIQSKTQTDALARQYLAMQIQRENIANYKGANTAYIDAVAVANAFGGKVLDIVANNITPYPGSGATINYMPVIGSPPSGNQTPQSQTSGTGTSDQGSGSGNQGTGNQGSGADPTVTVPAAPATTAVASKIPSLVKAGLTAAAMTAAGVGGYFVAPKAAPNQSVTVQATAPQTPVTIPQGNVAKTDDIEVF